jgi:tagaturonate reductase
MHNFLETCLYQEIIPTLDLPKDELEAYANDVLTRFANPYIKHMCSSIALNSVSKFKVRVLPSILEYKNRFGQYPKTLMFAFKKLMEFYKTDMTNDDPEVTAFMRDHTPREILANTDLWDMDLSELAEALEAC